MQSSSQTVTTNKPTPNLLHAGWSSCRPTNNVKSLKGIHTHSHIFSNNDNRGAQRKAYVRHCGHGSWYCGLMVHVFGTAGNLSLCFNGHFSGEPGLAGVYWSKGWWRWWWQVDYWSYNKSCKAPDKSSPATKQHPVFYRPDALPVAQPSVSKHWREKYHIPWTCLPQAHLGSSNFVSDH